VGEALGRRDAGAAAAALERASAAFGAAGQGRAAELAELTARIQSLRARRADVHAPATAEE
jgi:hypothetical protein